MNESNNINGSNNMNELNNPNETMSSSDYQGKEKKNNKKWLLLLLLLLFLCLLGYLVFRIGYSAGVHTRPVTPSPTPQKLLIKITDENGEWKTVSDSTGKIQVSPIGLSLEKSEDMKVYAVTTIPGKVNWSCSDETCVKVEPTEGKETVITALRSECTAVITAKVNDVVTEIVVNAVEKHDELKGIQLNKSNYVVNVGEKELVSVMAVPTTAELPELIYKIEDTSIATVDDKGVITGIKEGTTTITVSTVDGSFTTTATVTIKEKTTHDDKIVINPTSLSLEPNEERQIYATTTTDKPITWTSSDESCVTVSPKTGAKPTVKAGDKNCTAIVFAKSGDVTSEIVVNVVKTHDELSGIQLDKSNYAVDVGKTELVSVLPVPTTAELPELIYRIEDTSIATVDENGVITGVSEGTTTITVSTADGLFTATAIVTVNQESSGDTPLINQLNIFATTTSAREYIAPYDTGSYIFSVENAVSGDITYKLSLEEDNEDRVNIKYKLKKNGQYLISNWTYYNEIVLEDVPLASGKTDNYELEWSWVSENDELDTQIGLKEGRATYTVTIKVLATQNA